MIPRLWQCTDVTWWEAVLGAPFSFLGMSGLAIVAVLLRLWDLPGERAAPRILVTLAVSAFGLTTIGVVAGLGLRVCGLNPSWSYRTVRFVWLLCGWPLVFGSTWHLKRTAAFPIGRKLEDVLFWSVAAGAGAFALVMVYVNLTNEPAFLIGRSLAQPLFDEVTTWLQTDECLAEHRLQYLTWREQPYNFARSPGYSAERALYSRRHYLDLSIYTAALHSYRLKVRRHELRDPDTLDAARCSRCPGTDDELRAWANDSGQSEASRALARDAIFDRSK